MLQDRAGLIWVGNTEGLLRFDGVRWRRYSVPGESVRSLAIGSNGQLFVGGVGTLGFFHATRSGAPHYVELLGREALAGEDVWSTIAVGDDVFFQTFSGVYRFSRGRLNRVGNATPADRFHKAFMVLSPDGSPEYYVRQEGRGLLRFSASDVQFVEVQGGEAYAQEKIWALFRQSSGALLIATATGLETLQGSERRSISAPTLEAVLRIHRTYDGLDLGDGHFALGTLGGGLLIVNELGRIVSHLGPHAGLTEEDLILDVTMDSQGGLWLALGSGVARFDALAPLTTYDTRVGLPGAVYGMERWGTPLFAATELGLFRLATPTTSGEPGSFVPVGISEQVWGLLASRSSLLVATNVGVYALDDRDTPRLLLEGEAYTLRPLDALSETILVGTQNGIESLRPTSRGWERGDIVSDDIGAVRSIEVDRLGRVWAATYDSVFTLRVVSSGRLELMSRYAIGAAAVADLQGIVIISNAAVRRPSTSGTLVSDDSLTRLVRDGDTTRALAWSIDASGRLWISRGGSIRAFNSSSGAWRDVTPSGLRTLRDGLRSVYVDRDALWIGTESELLRYEVNSNSSERYNSAPSVLITQISTESQGMIWEGGSPSSRMPDRFSILSSTGAVRFDFVTPAFNHASDNVYRTRLRGMSHAWTEWSPEPWREYTNLSPGAYRFEVQSVTAQGVQAGTRYIEFNVAPRWFETWWSRLLATLLVLGLVIAIARSRVRIHQLRADAERARANELARLNAELQEADRLKDEMLANASHELRTPLTAILGYADLLVEYDGRESPAEVRETAQFILGGARRLYGTVQDLMDAAALRAGKVELTMEPVGPLAVINDVVLKRSTQAHEKGLVLRTTLPDLDLHSPLVVKADRYALERILDHLLDNAIKFTDEGGVVIDCSDSMEGAVVITISDSGRGIATDFMPELFTDFKQESTGFGRSNEGNGLGLFIVSRFAELMGIALKFQSESGSGTSVTLRLATYADFTVTVTSASSAESREVLQSS